METYTYQAHTHTGQLVNGSQQASSKKEVVDALLSKDMTPISIEAVSDSSVLKKLLNLLPHGRVSMKERVIFSRQFATMIGAGIPIARSLAILKTQTENKTLAAALEKIAHDVESGSTLSDSISKYPKIFSPVYVSMVHAGEVGGILDEVLNRLADQMEKDSELISKVRGAMVYPGLIFVVMIAALIFIMIVVVPQLEVVFDAVDTELPWNTQLLLNLSTLMRSQGFLIGAVAVVGGFLFVRTAKKNQKLRRQLHRVYLKIPVFGMITRKINIARFARTFGALLGSGIPVLEALKVVSDSLSNMIMQDELRESTNSVRNGGSLAKSLHNSKVFPIIVAEMIAIGEETGELEKILTKLADFYDKEVQSLVANLSSIIEPMILIVTGGLVGFIIISVIGPLYQLTGSF
jgi:type IV pilus assembly protein PilC